MASARGTPPRSEAPVFSSARTIVLSKLGDREKERFYEFILEQDIKFHVAPDGMYVANVRMYEPSALDALRRSEALKEDTLARSSDVYGRSPASAGFGSPFGSGAGAVSTPGSAALGASPVVFDYSCYPAFVSCITVRDTLRPKQRRLAWVMKLVEEIYDARYTSDTVDLKEDATGEGAVERPTVPFPTFVHLFFGKRYGLKQLVESTMWDLLFNVHSLRRSGEDATAIEVFARFLEETFDADDLLFFLYVRSVVEKTKRVSFKARWTRDDPEVVWLSYKDVQRVLNVVFGSDTDPMYVTFLSMVERNMAGPKAGKGDGRRVDVTHFLQQVLAEYHDSHPGGGTEDAHGAPGGGVSAPDMGESAAGLTREQEERLFREAEAHYEARAKSGGGGFPPSPGGAYDAFPSDAAAFPGHSMADLDSAIAAARGDTARAPPPPPPSGGRRDEDGDGIRLDDEDAARRLLENLGAAMHECNQEYLNALMQKCQSLPEELEEQIREEVQTQLETKVNDILRDVIVKTRTGGDDVDGHGGLAAQFQTLLAGSGGAVEIRTFCDAVLKTTELRQEIEPLVALLVTYAVARLQEGDEDDDGDGGGGVDGR